jgi:5-formyltetrahydrofolate cyclo-ligase
MKHEPNDLTPAQAKDQMRQNLKNLREQIPPDLYESASQGIWDIFRATPEFHKAKSIGAFASTDGEINTYSLLEGILSSGKNLYLPRVVKDKTHFDFYPVTNLKIMQPGAFGILEPTGTKAADWAELDLVLVPGLAFDRHGNRLGFGKGYYDRVLPLLRKSTLIVGLAYSFQMVDEVPVSTEDVPVKALLSEKGFSHCDKKA